MRTLRRRSFSSSSTRAIFRPPPVLPAQAPSSISIRMIALEKLGHRLKSVVAKPVVVIMLLTWKAACRTVSPRVRYIPRTFQVMSRVLPAKNAR